jgi:hypothetical protein
VPEQTLVGRLAQGKVEPDLVIRAAEPGAELGDVLGDERGDPARPERDADIGGRDDLAGEPAEPLPDLGAEHQSAHLVEDRGHRITRPERRELLGGHGGRHRRHDA